MTKGEVPTMAGQEQAFETAADQNQAAEQQAAPVARADENTAEAPEARQLAAEAVATAVAAEASAEQAPVEMASLTEAPAATAEADQGADKKREKKGEEEKAEAEEAPVDLAMIPEVEMLDAIAAADGARAMPGAEGEAGASLLNDDGEGGGFLIPLLALGAVGLGIAVALSNDDDELPPAPPPPPPPPPANSAPEITSGATAEVDENIDVDTVIYDASATDADGDAITFSISGEDADAFTIDAETGEVRFIGSPDFETQATYTFTITATDSEGATDTQEVTVTVNDVADASPVFSSAATVDVDENTDETVVILDADATDPDGGAVTFSLTGEDADAFTIDPVTGELRFVASPDFETQDTFNVTIVATDDEGDTTTQDVVVNVNDLGENVAPVIVSGASANVDENIDNDTVVYDTDATDADGDDLTYSISGEDAADFTIDPDTGEVRFIASPDFETQASYSFTVTATDPSGASDSQDVVLTVDDLPEGGPIAILLDEEDDDNNPNTEVLFDASTNDFLFIEDAEVGSFTRITGFGEGDIIQFDEGAEVSFSTSADDANDLQIIVNNNGVVSEIILDDVLADDAGLIFNEATAEAEVGFNFFQASSAGAPAAIAEYGFA